VTEGDAIARGLDGGEIDVDLLAATLRASSADLAVFVEVLAGKLEQALPGRVKVTRRAGRLLGKRKRVERVECDLGDRRYLLQARAGAVEARQATLVRGVVLKTNELPLEGWLDELSRDLAKEAGTSAQAQLVLQRLLTE